MRPTRHVFTLALAGSLAAGFSFQAFAQQTIKIGELNSYKAQPAFLDPYKKGWEMAIEEINAKGGVLGKKLEVISRDDGANPGEAVRVAEELVTREGVCDDRRHVPVPHRARGHELCRTEEGLLPRRGAAHRQDHLAERQQIYIPPSCHDLHAGRDADAGGDRREEESAGHWSIRISSTASRRPKTSRCS